MEVRKCWESFSLKMFLLLPLWFLATAVYGCQRTLSCFFLDLWFWKTVKNSLCSFWAKYNGFSPLGLVLKSEYSSLGSQNTSVTNAIDRQAHCRVVGSLRRIQGHVEEQSSLLLGSEEAGRACVTWCMKELAHLLGLQSGCLWIRGKDEIGESLENQVMLCLVISETVNISASLIKRHGPGWQHPSSWWMRSFW